jgi:ADP-ribose pyrophosphatase
MPLEVPRPRIKPWKRTKVETVGRHRVFDVQESEMLLPGGSPAPHPIYTLACPAWCSVLAITADDHAVFVWQYRHGTDEMSLEIPGGVLDPGESPMDAARRELHEETGFAADRLELLSMCYPNPAFQPNAHYSFVAKNARPSGPPHLDPTEECEVVLIPLSDLPALIDEGHVTHALCVVPLERFLRRGRR